MREETEDAEDTQTLNLKHLRAAVLVLTNPSVLSLLLHLLYLFHFYLYFLFLLWKVVYLS